MLPLVWAIKTAAHDGLSWVIAAALVVSIGSGVLFFRRQNRSATPMLDIKLFGYAPFWTSILANFLSIVGSSGSSSSSRNTCNWCSDSAHWLPVW